MTDITSPRIEGKVLVGPERDRVLSFSEFGVPHAPPVVWLHGTPGSRRQVPVEAREFAERENIRIIGIDRPGIGSSTAHVYKSFHEFTDDLAVVADNLGLEEMSVVGLSGGGPYTLAAARYLPDRVRSCAVLGGVAPTRGEDAVDGGLVGFGAMVAPLVSLGRVPIGMALTSLVRVVKPFASQIIDAYGFLSPEGDRNLLARPEFKAMFIDDLLNGSRKQFSAPFSDIMLFSKEWDFRLADVDKPVHWYHGDADHIVPETHGEHCVRMLPQADMTVLHGESHLGGMGVAEEILTRVLADWDRP
ncbi:alpha/beta fold hydrolase [Tomitella gaofuii]|uniref:alpha/beta fold hydrolase n=1 Tax=Tomitella gaofuii TaxID=2760083 RepID=UPI0015FA3EFD|nr:alpha/beta hydrolase [Tomitella gaofuii]